MTVLRSGISAHTTVVTVDAPLSNPSYPLFYDLDSETIKVVDGADTTEWQVERGVADTQQARHAKSVQLVANANPYGGGGGGVPDTWTFDDGGSVIVAPTTDLDSRGNVKIVASSDTQDALSITDNDNPDSSNFGIDPFGYISASGLDITATADVTVLKVSGQNAVHDVVQFRDASSFKFRMTFDGRILLSDLPTSDPGVAGQVYADGVPSAGVPKVLKISGG